MMFCSSFVDPIPKIRQTKPEKVKEGLKFAVGQLCSQPFIYMTCILHTATGSVESAILKASFCVDKERW